MVNQTPVLNMVNNSGTVFNNRNTGRNTYNIQNIGNDINIKKTITGKYSYYLDDRNNLYKKFHNGSHKFIRNKVYDISMNDKALYIIDLRYNIEYVAHSKIKNRNWKHIPNKDNNKFKSISANHNTLWAIDIYNNVYKIVNNKDIYKQPNVYLESISANGDNVYGVDIQNNLHQYTGDGWTSNKITTKGANIRDIAVGTSKIYGINKEGSTNHRKGFYVDGKYIIHNCNITRECTDNTYCKEKNYCCQKGSWVKGMCSDVSSYKGYIGNIEQNKTLDECFNLCKQTEGCNLYNYSSKDKECYLYSSLNFNNPGMIPNSDFESGTINYNNDGTVYYCSLPCDGEFMRSGSLPQVTSLSFGSVSNANNMLKAGFNNGFSVDDINDCKSLNVNKGGFVKAIIDSDTYLYGYSKGPSSTNRKYYGCTSKASFSKGTGKSNIVWKKSIYSFPRYSTEYAYTEADAKGICNIYGLKQCSQAEIEYRQQCACGWVSNKTTPMFFLNDPKGCKAGDKGARQGYNVCTKSGQKANTYCCGDVLDKGYSMCPPNYPYPVSTTKGLPIFGGVVSGDNTFCCNSSNNEKGQCNSKDLSVAFNNNEAVACANPPCSQYTSSTLQKSASASPTLSASTRPTLATSSSSPSSNGGDQGIWDPVLNMWQPIEEFTNYRKENIYRISIIICFCIIILILIYNFKY